MNFWEFCDKQLDRVDFKHIIGMVVTSWIMAIFSYVVYKTLHDNPDRYVAQIISALGNIIIMVLGYWFISSATKKDQPGTTVEETTITTKTTDNNGITGTDTQT